MVSPNEMSFFQYNASQVEDRTFQSSNKVVIICVTIKILQN